jgi:hypothetical protein
MTNKEIIESILNNDEKVIESLYDEYRSHFIPGSDDCIRDEGSE